MQQNIELKKHLYKLYMVAAFINTTLVQEQPKTKNSTFAKRAKLNISGLFRYSLVWFLKQHEFY